ncbi:MAG: ABC transporter ATP-binding protein [Spirochaetaceae bacterium]|jgi:ABC-type Fe3+/spermidine/putrescine transport system ATPase subunit|nr:ABC transporter ATP-binding protein [Spirochaetaceae bacterium]
MSLEAVKLTKTYEKVQVCLDLQVAAGETLALVGPSGCGKTTALHLIAGLIQAEAGILRSNGEDISKLPPHKRHIAVVFQDLALFPHLNVGKNIAYGLATQGIARRERQQRVTELLQLLRLPGYATRPIQALSGGERQRIAIARALAASQRALLLDEPFSSLDAPLRRDIRGEFLDLRRTSQAPCIFVTHDREEAALLGDRIALMAAGRVIETGSSAEVFLAPRTETAARFFGAGEVLPCTIRGERSTGFLVSSALGDCQVPFGSAYDPLGPLLFIPRDAFLLAGDQDRPPVDTYQVLRGVFRKSIFEGDRLTLEVEGPEQTLIRLAVGLRTAIPAPESPVRLYLDQGLLRFVKPGP